MHPRHPETDLPVPTPESQIPQLRDAGFVVLRRFVPPADVAALNAVARSQLLDMSPPVEFESDVQYPGAPESRTAEGGRTPRRLLDAYHRDPGFAGWATAPGVRSFMTAYFSEQVFLSLVHHNCLMTKHPRHGSSTGWHRDIRYWSFEKSDLISIWFALGEEAGVNGGLRFIPGSHRMNFADDRYDGARFFRDDVDSNAALIQGSECPTLAAGDAVVFHSNTLHSAGRNLSADVKLSLVFTYHARGNRALEHTRSASRPEISLT